MPFLLVRVLHLALIAILAVAPSAAFHKKGGGKKKVAKAAQSADGLETGAGVVLEPARIAGTIRGEAASDPKKQSDWPAIAHTPDGALWMAYVEWNDKDADRVLVRRRPAGGGWSEPVELFDGSGDHYAPALAASGNKVVVVWSAQVEGQFELYASEVGSNMKPGRVSRITTAPNGDFDVRAVSDAKGVVTIVWQSFRAGNSDIYARRRAGTRWGKEILVSSSTANDWDPAIALDSRGAAWISWDSYQHGNYDVFLRSLDGDRLGPVTPITTEPAAQFHSSVAVDKDDRVWIAWDDSGINWGKDFSAASGMPGSRGLHFSRSLGLRVWANGRLQQPSASLDPILTGRMTRYAELPFLAADKSGAIALVFRHWTETKPHEIYHFYATQLTGGKWTEPYRLADSPGQNSQRASLAVDPTGSVTAAYASDGRSATNLPKTQDHALHYVAYTSRIPAAAQPAGTAFTDVSLPAPGKPSPRRPRHKMTAGGKSYSLLMGDCHRHTDIRGHSGVDASVLDTYRYAIDAAQLDFLGTSDHNEVTGGGWPDGLRDYHWYWVQKAVDLFTHAPVFVGIYSYEHSMASPGGHRNVLFLKRGAPLRMIDRGKGYESADNSPPAMWKFWEEKVLTQPGQKSVIVPHTFASGPLADWNWPNARFDCLLEIYQGCRGSYEAWRAPEKEKRGGTQTDQPKHFAQDALAAGNVYGFVSFSDHASTHNSWAAVWALSEDRRGLIDGMYDRRTYAASDEIIVRAAADGHLPGEEWETPVSKPPRIEAKIEAPDTILRIDVVKDGKFVYTSRPQARTAEINYRDTEAKAGKSYYYIRVFQRDTEKPEGDPEIAWASPFYVTYR